MLEIGWLSKSTFRPLATHQKMCAEGLDGFAYRLQSSGAAPFSDNDNGM
jgi:hypothetical protein